MKEDFLHFIFKNRLWDDHSLFLTSGEPFEIIDTGILNHDSGPDFFNAKIKTDGTVWAGNIEIHVNSSDWYKHNHHQDFSYDNVILHIVFNNDKPVKRSNGETIPVWEIRFPHYLYNKYSEFKNSELSIPCQDFIDLVDPLNMRIWIERLGVERLERKTELILNYLNKNNSDWEEAFYILLARNFGFHSNSLPFELLALSTSLSIVRKNCDNLFTLEALLFGQAGFLNSTKGDAYAKKMKDEYQFLANKYSLEPIDNKMWKSGRLRPGNMPAIRIAQFSSLMQSFQGLFSAIIKNTNINLIANYFRIQPSEYWQTHYSFGKPSDKVSSNFGRTAFETIMINTIAPFRIIYSKSFSNGVDNVPIDWLEEIKPENNKIVKAWKDAEIIPQSAFESQALIQLKSEYCDLKKCLYCNIGTEIFRQFTKLK